MLKLSWAKSGDFLRELKELEGLQTSDYYFD